MDLLVIGAPSDSTELQEKFGKTHSYVHATNRNQAQTLLTNASLVFDFMDTREGMLIYQSYPKPVFFNTAFVSLSRLLRSGEHPVFAFGFCGLPSLLNRPVLEVTMMGEGQKNKLIEVCALLKTECKVVKDQTGLVSARIICMIINEAYCAVEEDTASRSDIDIAMKLGTNYPYGPFEWAQRIGTKNVCKLLDAVHSETGDVRYQACDLLRREAQ
jgi:3-hydroxybutyryl-CoA dehydrogenase